jgi:hypothetical protein
MPALWLALVSGASAQEERCKAFELVSFVDALDRSEVAFENGDSAEGTRLVDEAKARGRCLVEVPTPEIMARMASLEALAGHFDQDPERSVRWARAAEWVVPGHLWPGAVAADHPLRGLVLEEGPASVGAKGRHGFHVPSNGAVVVSGRLVVDTDVASDVPLLLQVCDGSGAVVRSEWLEGGGFPDDLQGNDTPLVPTWWTREVPEGAVRAPPIKDRPAPAAGGARVAVFGGGGGGSVGQSVDQPGDFLAAQRSAGGTGSVGGLARAPLGGPVGLFADGRVALPGAVGASEGFGGAAVDLGPVSLLVGGGFTTSPVFEGKERRRLVVGQPMLGVEASVPVGSFTLDARGSGGGLPGAVHGKVGADLRGAGAISWMAGLEAGLNRTGFVQPGSDRSLAVTGFWGGVRAGVTFGT